MAAEGRGTRSSVISRILLAIYRMLPLPVYGILALACRLLPPVRRRIGERLGISDRSRQGSPVIWFHASSVGEVSTIAPVVTQARQACRDCDVIITTMTTSGRRRARQVLGTEDVALVPIDFYPSMRRLIKSLRPSTLIIGETEIWPNMILEARRDGVSIILLNGRVSKKSFPRYMLIRPLMSQLLSAFDLLLMRTETDAKRITRLGADREIIQVAGNTKYDILPGPSSSEARDRTRTALGIQGDRNVIGLGSAREGEYEIALEALSALKIKPRPILIIAPRHMASVPRIQQVCSTSGFRQKTVSSLGSKPGSSSRDVDVLVIAEMGRLLEIYAICDVAIVGGTFRPFGGHNPLEPASQGAVTVVGPHIQNIEDDIGYLRSEECAFVTDRENLGDLLSLILSDGPTRNRMRERAITAFEAKKGIAKKCVEIMARRGLLPH
jgi:3-deoxy-D-manno-octulosonic-acid transferase